MDELPATNPTPVPPPFALILAGGSGTRFWPLSRDTMPKQLLELFGEKTLLEQTVDRLHGFVPPENTLVLTNALQEKGVRAILSGSGIPPENIIAEPEKRDTGPAIALAIGWVAAKDPEATMIVLPADQLIDGEETFRADLAQACAAAQAAGALLTLGIPPTWACPSYGYIERGPRASIPALEEKGIPVFQVARFREKPSTDLAEQFLAQGNFAWNAGIFAWTIPAVLRELSLHCPELAQFVGNLRKARDFKGVVQAQFPALTKTSIDYALMEKATKVLNIEASFGWDDVGNWLSVARYLHKDSASNAYNGSLSELEAFNNIVYDSTGTHIALLGVSDLIVVRTGDALLIADRDEAERIKELLEKIPSELR